MDLRKSSCKIPTYGRKYSTGKQKDPEEGPAEWVEEPKTAMQTASSSGQRNSEANDTIEIVKAKAR